MLLAWPPSSIRGLSCATALYRFRRFPHRMTCRISLLLDPIRPRRETGKAAVVEKTNRPIVIEFRSVSERKAGEASVYFSDG